jgi:hypothetical protein
MQGMEQACHDACGKKREAMESTRRALHDLREAENCYRCRELSVKRYWLLLAVSHLTRLLFASMLGRVAGLTFPAAFNPEETTGCSARCRPDVFIFSAGIEA